MSGDQIAQRLTSTALDVGPAGRDPYHGAGLVDPVAALGGTATPATGPPPPTATARRSVPVAHTRRRRA